MTDLSPEALSVWCRFCEVVEDHGPPRLGLARALRAVAERNEYKPDMRDEMEVMFSEGWNGLRKELFAIADELEQ